MEKNKEFKPIIESLFEGMQSFLTSNTVVGEAKTVGDTTIIPLVDVSFGVGAGAFSSDKSGNGGGGLGGKLTPCALIVITGDNVRLLRINTDKSIDRILELVPDVVSKFKKGNNDSSVEDIDISEYTE
ncbi:MAG: sporulation protein [Lachnospiraceae bacterium]|nr:sporulation protein [Lachnospiraceae bacterium]